MHLDANDNIFNEIKTQTKKTIKVKNDIKRIYI